jgi:glyoxylase-like metal-dependent hydrolase (beta-lactamase superfamily II)
MRITDHLYVLELPLRFGDTVRIMNLSLIVDPNHGLTLVDTGMPGQMAAIEAAIDSEGFSIGDVTEIVLTHQDIDHVGSLHPLKVRTRANVVAYVDEVPYIDGTLAPVKWPSPDRLAQMPEMAAMLQAFKSTPIDEPVADGHVLTKSGGAVVVATPGHTPGHMSLYLPSSKVLITGDALSAEAGVLSGPNEWATPDMERALQSVKKLADLDVETIVCYHGGLITDDASGQLKRLAG